MSDTKIVGTILLGLVALATGGVVAVLFLQTLSGLGLGGLWFVGIPILALAGVCALSVAAIVRIHKEKNDTAD